MTNKTLQIPTKVNSEFTYALENFSDIIFELPAIFDAWQTEVCPDRVLDIDWEKYLLLERNKSLIVQTARHNGKLVGVCIGMIANSMHFKSEKLAYSDLLFVLSEYRPGGKVAATLIKQYEASLRKAGVLKNIVQTESERLAKLLNHMGYTPTFGVIEKVL